MDVFEGGANESLAEEAFGSEVGWISDAVTFEMFPKLCERVSNLDANGLARQPVLDSEATHRCLNLVKEEAAQQILLDWWQCLDSRTDDRKDQICCDCVSFA
jgi:hypothetical protein